MTDYTENKMIKTEIKKNLSGFIGGPGLYEYDLGFCHTYLELDIYCKKCGEYLGEGVLHGADNDISSSGFDITKDTVCKKCGALLYDEKADLGQE